MVHKLKPEILEKPIKYNNNNEKNTTLFKRAEASHISFMLNTTNMQEVFGL